MRKAAVYGTAMILLATAANILHAVSHAGQGVLSLEAWQWGYVVGVIFVSPIVAAALLWTRYRLVGAWLLLASMVGSFVFDISYHFLIPGLDNVFTLQPGAWLAPFWVSSVLLVAVSGLGALVGAWAVARLSRFGAGTPSTAKAARPGTLHERRSDDQARTFTSDRNADLRPTQAALVLHGLQDAR